jgi:hypothetical protein
MTNGKKQKSSGWRPHEKRFEWDKWKTRHIATTDAKVRAYNDGFGHWRRCPVRRCRRAEACAGDPHRCQYPGVSKAAAMPNGNQRASIEAQPWTAQRPSEPPRFAISAKDAAAAIAASIANELETDPHDELEALLRGGSHPPPR